MNIRICTSRSLGLLVSAVAIVLGGVQAVAQKAEPFHGVAFKDSLQTASAPSGAHLTYYGGPVISNVQIRVVYWGSGVNAGVQANLPNFYTGVTNSIFFDMLSEYATPSSGGTNQSIGRGSYAGATQITPGNTATTIDDSQIQTELVAQINAGHLPQPVYDLQGNVNTEYMIYFPPGISITQGGSGSCVAGGFCAYHGTLTYNAKFMPYTVVPDFGPNSGCDSGCGHGTQVQNVDSASSHELAESVTDIGVGLATVFGPPLAWYDQTNGEIGDICNGQQSTIVTPNGVYTVQREFSNSFANCIVTGLHPNFSLASAGASSGTPFSLTLTAQNPGGGTHISFAGTVHFTSTDNTAVLPSDYIFQPSDQGVHVFSATLNTLGGSISATDTVNTVITATVTPATAAGFTLSATPASQSIAAGTSTTYAVTETPSGGFSNGVTLSVTGLPSGATSSFSPNPTTGSSTLTIATTSATATGSYPLTITGISGSITHTTSVTLVITTAAVPDFTLAASPTSKTVGQADFALYNITETPQNGFSGAVTFSVTGLPAGANSGFTTNPTTGSTSMYIVTHATTAVGTYALTVTGISGNLTHSIGVTLTITPHGAANFTLSATPASQTVTQGNSVQYTITETPAGGFSGAVTPIAVNVPAGVTVSFATHPFTGTTTMTAATTSTTPLGTFQFVVAGFSGSILHSTMVTLTVQ